jgi:hypothetical protein
MEVLLALVIIVALMGVMFGLYWRGLEVRDRTTALLDEVNAQHLLLGRLDGELQTAMVYPFLQFGMSGQSDRAEWITARVPGPGAWIASGAMDEPRQPESDIQIIGYRLRYGENERGEEIVLGLERTVQTVLAPQTAEEGDGEDGAAVSVDFVTSHVKFLAWRYFDGAGWADAWNGNDLPVAVEVTLGAEPLGEDQAIEDYDAPIMRRVIHLPAGLAAQGATVRGLGEGGPR